MLRAAVLPLACTLLFACQSTMDTQVKKHKLSVKPQPNIHPNNKRNAIIRIEPKYPRSALRKAVSGWVLISYSINQRGGTEDIQVLDSSPKGYFENSATAAMARWKYKPHIQAQEPVKLSGLQELIVYTVQ
ncbi:energy transducer TonB [Catenovulum agarivorans]|uniref:energy transducer TonB n=1 Tax=Catenovulum agarivorans TaxID=1172192 RepID=UPI0002F50DB1|nr:energy transducer TonB [Catenovulum agarivorans]